VTAVWARAIAAACIGAGCGAASIGTFYAARPQLETEFASDPPRLIRGLYPGERDPATGLTFAWTAGELTLRIPELDRRVDWELTLRIRGARTVARENPVVTLAVDGVLLETRQSATDFEDMTFRVPAARPVRTPTVISLLVAPTFVPGPADPRQLGVMLDRLKLQPAGVVRPPLRALTGAAVAIAALAAAMALLGFTLLSVSGAAVALAAGAGLIVVRGFGPYTDYPVDAARAACWIALASVLAAKAAERWQREPLTVTARFVAAFSAGALFLKLLVLLHPDMPVGDAMFHAHRFQRVLAGDLYFTSIAPGNYLFPYAPGFYVAAAPFAGLVTRGAADMALLRGVGLSVDALVAALLYRMVSRGWGDRTAGAIAVVLYHVVPLDFRIFTVGNLTNAFAQSLSVVCLWMFAAHEVRWERRWSVAALTLALAAAFMSHTSTFPILFSAAVLTAGLFWMNREESLRPAAIAVLLAAAVAMLLSIVLYYGHFGATYRTEFTRIRHETASAAPDAGGRPIVARLGSIPMYVRAYLGIPAFGLAIAGGSILARRRAYDRLTLCLAAWAASCVLFAAIGILTPVDMRYYLASIPAVAVAGAAGASRLWSRGGAARAISAVLVAWAFCVGVVSWWGAF
jgi:hypothetical protein